MKIILAENKKYIAVGLVCSILIAVGINYLPDFACTVVSNLFTKLNSILNFLLISVIKLNSFKILGLSIKKIINIIFIILILIVLCYFMLITYKESNTFKSSSLVPSRRLVKDIVMGTITLTGLYASYLTILENRKNAVKEEEKEKIDAYKDQVREQSLIIDRYRDNKLAREALEVSRLGNHMEKTDYITKKIKEIENLYNEIGDIKNKIERYKALGTRNIVDLLIVRKLTDSLEKADKSLSENLQIVSVNIIEYQKGLLKHMDEITKVENLESTVEQNNETSSNLKAKSSEGIGDINKKVIIDLESLIENFKSLDVYKQIGISLLLGDSVIISNLISISFIFFGDYLIKNFDLENKYPKLSQIIKLRRRFQRYYLILNIGLILIIVLAQIVFSIAILTI